MRPTNRTMVDLDALTTLFRHGVAGAPELIHLGLSTDLLHGRCRPGGPWQRLLPGILLLSGSPPTRVQRIQAALRYAGEDALLTGLDALHLHGLRAVPATGPVHVLVPHQRQLEVPPELRITRARHMPNPVLRKGFLTAPMARATLDAAVHLSREAITVVVAEALNAGMTPTDLDQVGARPNPEVRAVLSSLPPGPGAVVQEAGLPAPRWQVQIHTADGVALGTADAWWDDLALAWVFRGPPTTARTLAAAGVVVAHTPKPRLRQDPTGVTEELTRAATQARTRPRPEVIAI
jgi:hypothetical protein